MYLYPEEIAAIPGRRFREKAWRRLGSPPLPETAADLRAEVVAMMAVMRVKQLRRVVEMVREMGKK